MNINDDLMEKLTALAFDVTDNFCYSCYKVVKADKCPGCFSDDFMRHLKGVGVEYGTDWVIESLIQEHCEAIDADDQFEEQLNEVCGTVKIGSLEEATQVSKASGRDISDRLGVTVENLTSELAGRLNYELDEGVIVTQVKESSPAAEAGIQPGVLISSVNRKSVSNVTQFNAALAESKDSEVVLLLVKDREFSRFVALNLK